MLSFDKIHKAITYFTDTCDLVDAGKLFTNLCPQYESEHRCDSQHLCNKIHFDSVDQKIIYQIIAVLIKWDRLSAIQEKHLCLKPCRFKNCKKGSACTYLHSEDMIQKIALDMRYHYNCSFKWRFEYPEK